MTMFLDGMNVVYAGPAGGGHPDPGDLGHVLVADERAAHVKWVTGSCRSEVHLVEHDDLASAEPEQRTATATLREHLGQSLEFAGEDADSILEQMDASGGLDRLSMLSEEVIEWVASRVRTLGSFRERTATLEPGDADDLVQAATRRVLADAMETLEDEDE